MKFSSNQNRMSIRKFFLMVLFSVCFNGIQAQQQTSESLANYIVHSCELVWSEEFDQEGRPNKNFWSYEKGFVRNNELQYYQEENAFIKNGILVIEGRREKVKNPAFDPDSDDWRKNVEHAAYTSSSIHTREKVEFLYGILEVRAKVDTAMGMWPAIWTLGVERSWPSNGEVDIMEFYRRKGKAFILANAAWKGTEPAVTWDEALVPLENFLAKDPDWPEKFHVWTMHWTSESILLYLDGELLNEIDLNKTVNPDGFNPFHQPHYLLLNLAIGSNGGNPEFTDFPKRYQIDYVRLYKEKAN